MLHTQIKGIQQQQREVIRDRCPMKDCNTDVPYEQLFKHFQKMHSEAILDLDGATDLQVVPEPPVITWSQYKITCNQECIFELLIKTYSELFFFYAAAEVI